MRSTTMELQTLRIMFDESGEGDRPLVLLHGLTGHRRDFALVLPELAAHGRTLAPDLRGHGDASRDGSEDPDRAGHDFETIVEDQVRMLDALGVERCDVLGHSFGGMVALRLTLTHPDRVASLVLMSTSSDAPDNLGAEIFEKAGGFLRARGMAEFQSRLERVGRERETPLAPEATDEQRDWRARYWDHHRLRHLAMDPNAYEPLGLAMTRQEPVTDRLGEIHCPTRVIIGDADADFVRGAGLLRGGIPDAVVHALAGIDHQPHQEARARFLEIMADHLNEARSA